MLKRFVAMVRKSVGVILPSGWRELFLSLFAIGTITGCASTEMPTAIANDVNESGVRPDVQTLLEEFYLPEPTNDLSREQRKVMLAQSALTQELIDAVGEPNVLKSLPEKYMPVSLCFSAVMRSLGHTHDQFFRDLKSWTVNTSSRAEAYFKANQILSGAYTSTEAHRRQAQSFCPLSI